MIEIREKQARKRGYKRPPFSAEWKLKLSLAHLGKVGPWKGKKRPNMTGDNHPLWKKNVSYSGLHHWIKRELGVAHKCMNIDCIYPRLDADGRLMKKPKKFEWANISRKYKRDTNDFISLCVSCHQKWDLDKISIRYDKNS